MNMKLSLTVLIAGLGFSAPIASALNEASEKIAFKYDRSAPIERTYNLAKRTAENACGLHSHVAPLHRSIKRDCVTPMLGQFVVATGDETLIAYHETQIGEQVSNVQFATY